MRDVDGVDDPQPALNDPRIARVVVTTPNDARASLACAAVAVGNHVLVYTLLAVTRAAARSVAALAQMHGLLLSVTHDRRWDADFLGVRQPIANGLMD